MGESVKNDLGKLLVNQEALLDVLAKSHSSLNDYPELQEYLARKNPNVVQYNRALREGQFTKQEFLDEIGERLNWLAYDAWIDGYQSHYKLTNYCQDKFDCKAP